MKTKDTVRCGIRLANGAALSSLATFVAAAQLASAATIIVQNTNEEGTGASAIATSDFQLFDNTDPTTTNDGYGVLGRMNLDDAAIATFHLAGNLSPIAAGFEPFSTPFPLDNTGLAGAFHEARSADTRVSINRFGGSAIYLWAYRGLSLSGASEHLIVRLAATFPTDPEFGPPLSASAMLSPVGAANLVVGRFAAFSQEYGGGEALPSYNTVPVGVVPEPSITVLVAVGALAFRRRRGSRSAAPAMSVDLSR